MKKKSNKGLVLTAILFVLVIFVAIILFYALSLLGKFNQVNNSVSATGGTNQSNDTLSAETIGTLDATGYDLSGIDTDILNDQDVTNILLIGQDRRSGETGRTRSDTMIICSINAKTNQIALTSLMRDMYVPIPGYGANRINSAYVLGGMELLDAVIAQDFGVKIDANVEVDFDGFLTALAEVGPLTVNLTAEEAEYMTNNPLDGTDTGEQPWSFDEGDNLLYSGALLQYVRMRYVGNSDFDRTERQKTVIKLAFAKIKDMNVFSLMNLAGKILPTLTTDLSTRECLSYVYSVISKGMSVNNESMRLPIDGGYDSTSINGMSVLVPDLQTNAEAVQMYIYGKVLNTTVASFTADDLSEDTMGTNLNETASSSEREEYGWDDPTVIDDSSSNSVDYSDSSTDVVIPDDGEVPYDDGGNTIIDNGDNTIVDPGNGGDTNGGTDYNSGSNGTGGTDYNGGSNSTGGTDYSGVDYSTDASLAG